MVLNPPSANPKRFLRPRPPQDFILGYSRMSLRDLVTEHSTVQLLPPEKM
jgi:hypothetical protein